MFRKKKKTIASDHSTIIYKPPFHPLEDRIKAVEQEIRELKCEKHVWKANDRGFYGVNWMVGDKVEVKCQNCGKSTLMTEAELKEYKLDQALDEVERLGGEVTR